MEKSKLFAIQQMFTWIIAFIVNLFIIIKQLPFV